MQINTLSYKESVKCCSKLVNTDTTFRSVVFSSHFQIQRIDK